MHRFGSYLFGVSVIAFGIQQILSGGIVVGMDLIPDWLPAHVFLAYVAGLALIVAGMSIVSGIKAALAERTVGFGLLASALLVHLPRVLAAPHDLGQRTGLFEALTLCGGAWVLASKEQPDHFAKAGRYLFAVSMVVFGISHLDVPRFIAGLIPGWIPGHLFWAYLTAVAFIAAGLSIAVGKWSQTGAALLSLMLFLWVILLHAPRIAGAFHDGGEWNSGFVALAMSGCALAIANARFHPLDFYGLVSAPFLTGGENSQYPTEKRSRS